MIDICRDGDDEWISEVWFSGEEQLYYDLGADDDEFLVADVYE